MHLQRDLWRHAALPVLACALLLAGNDAAIAQDAAAPSRKDVASAAARVASDPELGGTEKSRHLRFKDSAEDKKKKPDADIGQFPAWLRDFVRAVVEGARIFVWLLGALAVALVVVGIRRWIKVRAESALPKRGLLPSHVQSLDIRPESLPADVGAAAAALWSRGEQLAALSLLYRGALSRLVHGHGVPIRGASTEGECVTLAERVLAPGKALFFARLVKAWQLAVYGARLPETDDVLALCRDFAPQLGAAVRAEVQA